ncbi:MAG: cobaltochelatase subunit CobN, partial [Acidaminococcaceae bacterium]|nr:cobaltochelatase subunit CobN [Acidaminococcaceae bacterium]
DGEEAGVEKEIADKLKGYTFYGGSENFRNFWLYASSLADTSIPAPEGPKPRCWAGIYHPDMPEGYMTDLPAYRETYCKPGQPVIGLLFYREEWIWEDLAYPAAFIREAERQGCSVIAVFTNQLPDEALGMPGIRKVFEDFFTIEGKTAIDTLVTTMKFSHVGNGSLTVDELETLGVPVLTAYTLLTPEEDWRKNPEGLNPVETSIAVALPEFDGAIHGIPIAGRRELPDGAIEYIPLPQRMAAMAAKAKKWANLHKMKNEDKKIALIFHNYPPKNYNIGSASGLDSMESATRLLARMKEDGYRVDFLPASAEEFIRIMTSHATNDLSLLTDKQAEECQKLSAKEYTAFFNTLPEEARQKMIEQWGEAPGSVMLSDEGNILIPGTMNGNVFMTVQPARHYGMDPSRAYHDPMIAPTHQYLAFYYWLREIFQADAVIHLGTHGNLEWLPGKATGLDEASYPDIALGPLPNIYPYLMTISGEGVIAKRRSSACLIGYLPAPVEEAGAFDELAELEKMADEYSHFQKEDSEQAAALEEKILELAHSTKIDESVPRDETKPFSEYLADLHAYMEDLQDSEIHVGLHVLGQAPEGDVLVSEILHLLRLSNGDVPSLYSLWAEKYGADFSEIEKNPSAIIDSLHLTGGELLRKIRSESREFVASLAAGSFSEEVAAETMKLSLITAGPEEWQQKISSLAEYIIKEIYPRLTDTKNEMEHTL